MLPNTEWLQEVLPRASDGGLIVDETMACRHPNIYAAGDCCTVNASSSSLWFQHRLWGTAQAMGMTAAQSMTGSLDPLGTMTFEVRWSKCLLIDLFSELLLYSSLRI